VANALKGDFCDQVLLTRSPEISDEFSNKIPTLLHDKPTRAEAIALAVQRLSACDGIMFLQADQPLVGEQSIQNLLFAFRQNANACYRLSFGERQASPIIFPARLFDRLKNTPPHHGGNYIFQFEQACPIYAERQEELFDIDTPADLQLLESFLQGKE
jgi:CTP:molybdopterin cytidylyltransferase MocA